MPHECPNLTLFYRNPINNLLTYLTKSLSARRLTWIKSYEASIWSTTSTKQIIIPFASCRVTAGDVAIIENVGEESETSVRVSELVEPHISEILLKIDRFTQLVSELLESGKSMFKEMSIEFEREDDLNPQGRDGKMARGNQGVTLA